MIECISVPVDGLSDALVKSKAVCSVATIEVFVFIADICIVVVIAAEVPSVSIGNWTVSVLDKLLIAENLMLKG